ncbi:Uracil phosphoribosyltransferase [Desulfosporosinus sp. I2]|uniref:hypothetical protein n=1 Tax=Desulfosporosinus sp. I2 TaxID=1617025 RepID=UPI0005EE0CCD|nr:hypothetical protein [Desulfosporosinus sp. I2]KJR46851.1 Uracil phosphoribosyltransferase [Desulfosporosinus sp. I2]
MSDLTYNKNTPLSEKIPRESGERTFPIWLLFNPKHPVVRHYIWKLVLAEIQDKLYRELHTRIDTTNIYIRNAVSDSRIVPNTVNWWGSEVATEIDQFREIIIEHQPRILISFGSFPFEFVRRAYKSSPEKGPKYWCASTLGDEFVKSIEKFDINKTNIIPLLRRVTESDKFIENHTYFASYYHYVGTKIAEQIIENKDSLNIWIE